MHTDEAWLSGLSRAIMNEGRADAVEPFLDLLSRSPHAIKILYHFLQVFFIRIFGYGLFSARLPSLIAGAACLACFGKLITQLTGQKGFSCLAGIAMLSLQIQFIYASHFGRQEIFILLFMLLSLNILFSDRLPGFRRGLLSGLPISVAAGFHPNAFITAWPTGLILLLMIISKRRRASEGAGYILSAGGGAAFFVLLSLLFNHSFTADYSAFGNEVGVFEPLGIKLLGFDDFFRKLFMRISGTYYTPRITPVFLLAAAAVPILLADAIRKKRLNRGAAIGFISIAGICAGICLLGKYSPPSIVFIIPYLILLITSAVAGISAPKSKLLLTAAFTALLAFNSTAMIIEEAGNKKESYMEYISRISAEVPAESRILGRLSEEYATDYGKLTSWRNLSELKAAGITVEEYLRQREIEYIVYPEEIDYIFQTRPVWNLIYGNPAYYYQDLQKFLREYCELQAVFISPGYGTRITLQRYKKNWEIRIYRVR